MLTWNRFPFIRISIAAIFGILIFENQQELWSAPILTCLVLSISFVLLWLLRIKMKILKLTPLIGLVGLSLIGCLLGWIAKDGQILNKPDHWRNSHGNITMFQGTIISDHLDKNTNRRYSVQLEYVKNSEGIREVIGNLHLYVNKTRSENPLEYGDKIRVHATPREIPAPTNPEEFNYSAYVARLGIHGQCFVQGDQIIKFENAPPNKLLGIALGFRNHLKLQIKNYIQNEEAQAIALALLIGVKDYLTEDLKFAYSSAGAMHVLAVSGLHVGILYLLLLAILNPLKSKKGGKVIIALIAMATIWFYTFITGMSPSVLRAAVMFSVMATSEAVNRDNNVFNSLGIACFILLLYDPNLLFSVGFQLSFLALMGIVYLQPKIFQLVYVSNPILNKIWQITAVSIAAQIATLPLTVYYFHQFPTYFFLSNLVVIPGATLIMILGIGMLVFGSIVEFLGTLIGFVLDLIIQLMNLSVHWVESIPGSLITWLYFDNLQVWLVYGFIILALLGFYHRSLLYLNTALFTLLCVFGSFSLKHWQQIQKEEVIIYDISRTTAIDHINGATATLYVDSRNNIDHELLRFQVNPFRRSQGLKPYDQNIEEFEHLGALNSKLKHSSIGGIKLVLLDSMLIGYDIHKPIETDILIINNQSVQSVDWLMKHFRFDQLILGSKNSTYYSERVIKELNRKGIEAHSLLLQGSWRSFIKSNQN